MGHLGKPPESINKQLQEMQQEIALMRKLATRDGFFQYYFQELAVKEGKQPKHRTMVECFHYCNEKYYDLFGEHKYTTHDSFRHQLNKEQKK